MKENDIDFIKKIHIINSNYDGQSEYKNDIDEKNKELIKFINIKCLSLSEMWEIKYNLLVEYANENKKIPTQKEKYKNINIGIWLNDQT